MSTIEEKYADRVSPEHVMAMTAIGSARIFLGAFCEWFRKLDAAERHAHNVGHIVDPTLYRDMIQSKNFARQIRLVRAALAFVAEIDAIQAEVEAAEHQEPKI